MRKLDKGIYTEGVFILIWGHASGMESPPVGKVEAPYTNSF